MSINQWIELIAIVSIALIASAAATLLFALAYKLIIETRLRARAYDNKPVVSTEDAEKQSAIDLEQRLAQFQQARFGSDMSRRVAVTRALARSESARARMMSQKK